MRIAILGAESTGKTQLANAIWAALDAPVGRAVWVQEALRYWCDVQQRTPTKDEQLAIAQEQTRNIESIPASQIVIADTTALMTAVYSDVLFNDASLYSYALAAHRSMDITLVTGLDLPWVADGIQRDSPLGREKIDQRLRNILQTHRINYSTVYGTGTGRTSSALSAIAHHTQQRSNGSSTTPKRWKWTCSECFDPDCEHRLFSALSADSVSV